MIKGSSKDMVPFNICGNACKQIFDINLTYVDTSANKGYLIKKIKGLEG